MPDVRPFRAWRYDIRVAGPLDDLICPPYDVIGDSEAQRLRDRQARNVVHLELGAGPPDPAAPDNRYVRAAATLDRWIAEGVLRQDATPGLYVYEQRFTLDGRPRRRLTFFAAVRLAPWAARDVLPHETTLAAPKADRLALLEATRANISPIYALCDPDVPAVTTLLSAATSRAPDAAAIDDAGEGHRLWQVTDQDTIEAVTSDLAARRLVIADGHHRYETALTYAERHGAVGAAGPDGAGYALMAVTPADDPGLAILPTHRLLHGLDPSRLEHALAHLEELFHVEVVAGVPPATRLTEALRASAGDHGIGLYTPGRTRSGARVLRPRGSDARLVGLHPALRALDVALLHTLLFEHLLGLGPVEMRRQSNVDYTRDADEALRLVDAGAYQAAALLNGTPPSTVLAVAGAGASMPQKSTYFYPKLATGMVMRSVASSQ